MTAVIDLDQVVRAADVEADVCIVGGGTAGLFLAKLLSRTAASVVILEAGGRACTPGDTIDTTASFSSDTYAGATAGRAFGWGGTSSRWGGLLMPYTTHDLGEEGQPDARTWRHIVKVVTQQGQAVRQALGLDGPEDWFAFARRALPNGAEDLERAGIATAAAEALPFRRRNFTHLDATAAPRVRAYLNAVACQWGFGRDGLEHVTAVSPSGRNIKVLARSFVLAAGAIESARILLEIDRATESRMLEGRDAVGELCDHLSWSVADVRPDQADLAASLFAPRFQNGVLRSLRFIVRGEDTAVPRHFAHFVFENENPGFVFARKVLAAVQARSLGDAGSTPIAPALNGLAKLAYHRYVKRRLFIPRSTRVHLQIDIEQAPCASNRVTLSADTDRRGRPMTAINWRVNDADRSAAAAAADRFLRRWPDRSRGFPALSPRPHNDASSKPWDAYHPVRTCRMGDDASAVADLDLRVRGVRNLYALTTGVFPSAGCANPTFSLLCFAEALADRLRRASA